MPHTPAIPPPGTHSGASLTQVDKDTCPRIFLEVFIGNSQGVETIRMPTHKGVDKSQGHMQMMNTRQRFVGMN